MAVLDYLWLRVGNFNDCTPLFPYLFPDRMSSGGQGPLANIYSHIYKHRARWEKMGMIRTGVDIRDHLIEIGLIDQDEL